MFAQAAGLSVIVSETCCVWPVSAQAERNGLADAVWPKGAQQRLHMPDRLAFPGDENVALMDAR